MQRDDEDILSELAHQRQAVRMLNERRRVLDLQAAQYGSHVQPHIVMEIASLSEQIQAREATIANLRSQVAADQVPVEEIEYHAMLAEEWDKSSGRLTQAQQARLNWARVRLGISLERAQAMEQPVRVQLAEEVFDDLNLSYLPHNYENQPKPTSSFNFDQLRKAILLDVLTTICLFEERHLATQPIDIGAIESGLIASCGACRQDDSLQYQQFLQAVRLTLS